MEHLPRQLRSGWLRCAAGAILAACALDVAATEIIYRPVNPAFGGDPANGPVLLNSANAQNKKTDPSASAAANAALGLQTPLQQFNDTLQRAILSRIAASASNGVFNASGQLIPGVVDTASFRITIVDLGGGVLEITTLDKTNGQVVSFQVTQ